MSGPTGPSDPAGPAGPTPAAGPPEPVAVVGIGCRFAGDVDGPEALWRRVAGGEPTVGEVPPERWRPEREHSREHAAALERVTHRGSFLSGDVDGFDAAFFGISPAEAEQLDPQQRLALEVSWEACEDAGIDPTSLAGSDAAVILGVGTDDHGRRLLSDLPHVRAWTGIGSSLCGVPNRVSHALDLRGPSFAVDTACSSSLVAIHSACAALRAGESRTALAGGVMLMTGPGLSAVLDEAGATGPDGRSKPFDAAADGYGRGEGAGVVVLKLLAHARADGDEVYAVIRGGAVRQDGRTDGIMAPHGAAQVALMRAAYAAAGVDPGSVGYVEAHGTGTPAGDPLEARALCEVLARPADAPPCHVGSVKSVLGHTEAAAGVAGLIAAIGVLRHRHVPAMPAVAGRRTDVPWDDARVAPATAAADWPDPGHPRRAGVASYGYGGTIAHLVLEEAPQDRHAPAQLTGAAAFPLSAASPEALAAQAGRLAAALDGGPVAAGADPAPPLADVAATLTHGRAALRHRAVVTAGTRDDLVTALRALAERREAPGLVTGTARADGADAVWVFSGHGAQWTGMGAGLLDVDPEFTAVLDRLAPIYAAELGATPREIVTAGDLGGVDRIQAALVALQLGLAASWRARGLRPAAVIGHSVGEIAAAVVAGALDEADGARLACRRSSLLPRVAGRGAMVLVDLPFEDCAADLADDPDVSAAIMAAPGSTVAAGTPDAVATAAHGWEAAGRTVRRVDSDVAFHTAQMAPLATELAAAVADLHPRTPSVPRYVTARVDPRGTTLQDAAYWAENLREPVRFAAAAAAALADGHRTFLEVSAHPVVAHSLTECLAAAGVDDGLVVASLRRDRPEAAALDAAAAVLACRGVPAAPPAAPGRRVRLPGTVWQRRTLRVERRPLTPPGPAHTLLGAGTDVAGTDARVWTTTLHARTRPYPGRHPVLGVEIVPAAVTLATYLAAAGGAPLRDVALHRPVVVPDDGERERALQVVREGDALRLASCGADGEWTRHSSARIARTAPADADDADAPDGAPDPARAGQACDPATIVDGLAALGVAAMGFGWRVATLHRGPGALVAEVEADPRGVLRARSWACLLDAALSAASLASAEDPALRMPAALARLTLAPDVECPERAVVVVARDRDRALVVDVAIRGTDGTVLARMDGLRYAEPDGEGAGRAELGETAFALAWTSVDHPVDGPVDVPVDGPAPTAPPVLVEAGDDPRVAVPALLDAVRGAAPGERVWAVVHGLRAGTASAGAGAVAGVGRVLATETPETFGGVLDLPAATGTTANDPAATGPAATDTDVLAARLARPGTEPVVSLDDAGEGWLAPRATGLGRAVAPAPVCRPDGTYLVTGGLGALGLAVAAHLAGRGARRLVLLGRTPLPPRAHWAGSDDPRVAAVRAIEAAGATVFAVAADVTDADAVAAALDALPVPPVAGVVHAAGQVRSGPALDLDAEDLDAVLAAKLDGADVLDALFAPGTLDFLALFSSCGPLLGLPGQAAYSAANAGLDALAARRRAAGDLGTVSIAWTSWRGLGMATAAAATDVELDARGSAALAPDRALAALDRVLAARRELPGGGTVAVLPVRTGATGPRPALLADLAVGDPVEPDDTPPWQGVGGAGLRRVLTDEVTAALGGVLGTGTDELDPGTVLADLGVDSLLGATLRVRLERRMGLRLAPTLLWNHPTLDAVAGHLADRLEPDLTPDLQEAPA